MITRRATTQRVLGTRGNECWWPNQRESDRAMVSLPVHRGDTKFLIEILPTSVHQIFKQIERKNCPSIFCSMSFSAVLTFNSRSFSLSLCVCFPLLNRVEMKSNSPAHWSVVQNERHYSNDICVIFNLSIFVTKSLNEMTIKPVLLRLDSDSEVLMGFILLSCTCILFSCRWSLHFRVQ